MSNLVVKQKQRLIDLESLCAYCPGYGRPRKEDLAKRADFMTSMHTRDLAGIRKLDYDEHES